jgi:hypothetical protein
MIQGKQNVCISFISISPNPKILFLQIVELVVFLRIEILVFGNIACIINI